MNAIEAVSDMTVLFTIALALSLAVERLLEVLKTVYDLLDSRLDWYKFWTRRAHKIRNRLEGRLRIFEYVEPQAAQRALRRFSEFLVEDQAVQSSSVPVLSGDLVRTAAVKSGLKIIGVLVGVGLAFWLQIDLLETLKALKVEDTGWPPDSIFEIGPLAAEGVRYSVSGIAIGLGSGPLHKIIARVEKAQKQRSKRERANA